MNGRRAHPSRSSLDSSAILTSRQHSTRSLAGRRRRSVPRRPSRRRRFAEGFVSERRAALAPSQRYIRGLYAGGTLAYEAQLILHRRGFTVSSNAPLPGPGSTGGRARRPRHGRRRVHARAAASDDRLPRAPRAPAQRGRRSVSAVVLLDFVLGYGAAADPVGDLTDAIESASPPSVGRRPGARHPRLRLRHRRRSAKHPRAAATLARRRRLRVWTRTPRSGNATRAAGEHPEGRRG